MGAPCGRSCAHLCTRGWESITKVGNPLLYQVSGDGVSLSLGLYVLHGGKGSDKPCNFCYHGCDSDCRGNQHSNRSGRPYMSWQYRDAASFDSWTLGRNAPDSPGNKINLLTNQVFAIEIKMKPRSISTSLHYTCFTFRRLRDVCIWGNFSPFKPPHRPAGE
jgi:hypothetical protein